MTSARQLVDEIAVRDVVLVYARGVDRKDLGLVASCFTPDCAYEGTLGHGTIANALAALGEALHRYERTMHFMGTQEANVDGDVAHLETYCIAYHVRQGTGAHSTVGVRYLDDLVRTAGRWRICRRVVRTQWAREDPATAWNGSRGG